MHFAKHFLEVEKVLKDFGFEVEMAPDVLDCIKNPYLNENEEHCAQRNIIKESMNKQKDCDAIIVLNHPKENIEGYIGANTLIELGISYFLNQKIFLLYPPSSKEKSRATTEITLMNPIILNGDIHKIKNHL